MTRSQKFLFLTWAPISGNNRYTRASEFWDDLLVSSYVKRRRFDYSVRPHEESRPKASIANVIFSFSELKYFFECPYQFKLRVLYGFNVPIHEALGYGKSLHDALADINSRVLRGDHPTLADVERLVDTHLHAPFAYPALRETLRDSARRVVSDYIRDNERDFERIEYSEKGIEISLGDGVSIVGRIDLVRRIDTNEIYIVDFKTRDRVQPEDVTEDQLNVYVMGYQELTGRRPEFVEVYDLDERKRRARSVDDVLVEEVKTRVRQAAVALREGTMPPLPLADRCQRCDFRKLCGAAIGVVDS
jgi:DNA helicase-2/ATP-dependent DNA helicase PcrA